MGEVNPGKPIGEVLPHLKLQGDLQQYLSDAQITKIALDRSRNCLHIFLTGRSWIRKQLIYALEKEIQTQLFRGTDLSVEIFEDFRLSAQYSPERLFEVYFTSMKTECRMKDILLFYMLEKAEFSFPEKDRIEVLLEDSVIAREKERELQDYLDMVFKERCRMDVRITLGWKKAEAAGKHTENKEERRLRERAQKFLDRTGNGEAEAFSDMAGFGQTVPAYDRNNGKENE
ncbi:MAG: hypothetical protein HUJ73_06915, partial [Eubacterium sp.]|nr:hypothetical protein [Eubacterium sp.]